MINWERNRAKHCHLISPKSIYAAIKTHRLCKNAAKINGSMWVLLVLVARVAAELAADHTNNDNHLRIAAAAVLIVHF